MLLLENSDPAVSECSHEQEVGYSHKDQEVW